MESVKTETTYETEHLTSQELKKLRKMTLGYGNFKKTAIKLDMPIPTLRDVLNKEYGEPATIEKIRTALTATA